MHFYDTSTSSLYPLSLHDALPILGGGVRRPGDHAVGLAQLDHHGAEVGDVLDLLARLLEGHALLGPQPRVLGREAFDHLRIVRGDDPEMVERYAAEYARQIRRAHVRTPVTWPNRMPSSSS